MIINYVIIILFPYTLKLLYMNTYEFPIVNYLYFQHIYGIYNHIPKIVLKKKYFL